MYLRKILNVIVVVAVVGAISAVFIMFYNKTKLDDSGFGNSNDKLKTSESSQKNDDDVENGANLDDTEEENGVNIENDYDAVVSPSDVSVESTDSFRNEYLIIIGGLVVLIGAGTIMFKSNC